MKAEVAVDAQAQYDTQLSAGQYIYDVPFDADKFIGIDSKVNNIFNPIHSFVMSIENDKILQMESRLKDNYTIIVGKKFPSNYSHSDIMLGVLRSHVECIRHAQKLNLDHVFIFEDDVIFINNWRNIVSEFINNNEVNIIKFDRLPYNIIKDCPDYNKVYFHKTMMSCSLGGYYLSKLAINTMLDRFDRIIKNNDKNLGMETLWNFLASPFNHEVYTTSPRICIQDWYRQGQSNIQASRHLTNLKNMQERYYLSKYGHFYPEFASET